MAGSVNPKRVPRIVGLTPSEAVKAYADVHLAAAVWQTSDFRKLDIDRQVEFRELIKSGEFFGTFYKALLVCLQHEVPLRDRMIDSLHHFRKIQDGVKLSESERKCLLHRQQELWFQYVRLLAEETVLHSDVFPEELHLTGRWRPRRMSSPMQVGELASKYKVSKRGAVDRLKSMALRSSSTAGSPTLFRSKSCRTKNSPATLVPHFVNLLQTVRAVASESCHAS